MKYINIFPVLFCIALIFSCQKNVTIDIPVSEQGEQLFIEGILFVGKKSQVYLSETKAFFDTDAIPQEVFARGATVRISDGNLTDELRPDSVFDKFRCRYKMFYQGDMVIEKDKTYNLEIIYKGETYRATTNTNQSKVEIQEVTYAPLFFDIYGDHEGVKVDIIDVPGEENFYRFQMNRWIDTSRYHASVLDVLEGLNDCTQGEKFYVEDFGRVVFPDAGGDGNPIEMYVEVSYEYLKDDSTYVMIHSMDKESAEFYKDLDDQLQSIFNPFVEPVLVESKIEGAMGIFGSVVLSDSILFVYPQDED